MMAKKKPIEVLKAADLNVDIAPRLRLLQVAEPPARAPGIKVSSVQELIVKLREQTKVVS
jgi:electron transfer flavoprotein beta subunit